MDRKRWSVERGRDGEMYIVLHIPNRHGSILIGSVTGPESQFVTFGTDIDGGAAYLVRMLVKRFTNQTQQLQV